MLVESGLEAEAFPDFLPAQWSKLDLQRDGEHGRRAHRACRRRASSHGRRSRPISGMLVHELMDEGKRVAAAAGIALHEDPWR